MAQIGWSPAVVAKFFRELPLAQLPSVRAYLVRKGIEVADPQDLAVEHKLAGLAVGASDAFNNAASLWGEGPLHLLGRLAGVQSDLQALRDVDAVKMRGKALKPGELAIIGDILTYDGPVPNHYKNGVIGAGAMGKAIAYKSAIEGIEVAVYEENPRARNAARLWILLRLAEGVDSGSFTPERAGQIFRRMHFVDSLNEVVKGSHVVHEAIFENFDVKVDLFRRLQTASDSVNGAGHNPVFATNTSSFVVGELAKAAGCEGFLVGMHFFNPVEQNPGLEIIRPEGISDAAWSLIIETTRLLRRSFIETKDVAGFAVNRIFAPWYNEACLTLEEWEGELQRIIDEKIAAATNDAQKTSLSELRGNLRPGLIAMIDEVYRNTSKVGLGPFALMNFTGKPQPHGLPIYVHTSESLAAAHGEAYKPAPLLVAQNQANQPWDVVANPKEAPARVQTFQQQLIEKGVLSNDVVQAWRTELSERILGTDFLVALTIEQEKIASPRDLDIGVRHFLARRVGVFETMTQTGADRISLLVKSVVRKRGFKQPSDVRDFIYFGEGIQPNWALPVVTREYQGSVAIITMNRPEAANALNRQVLEELEDAIREAQANPEIRSIVLKHHGKDFAGGADTRDFVAHMKKKDTAANMAYVALGHRVLGEVISNSKKPVIAIADGAAIGGGLELFLAAEILVATPRFKAGLPEITLGLVPGFGGAWSVVNRAGVAVGRAMILGGMEVNGEQALALGLTDHLMAHIGEENALIQQAEAFPWQTGTRDQFLAQLRGGPDPLLRPASLSWRPLTVYSPFAAQQAKILITNARKAPTLVEGLQQAAELLPVIFEHPDALEGLTNMKNPKF